VTLRLVPAEAETEAADKALRLDPDAPGGWVVFAPGQVALDAWHRFLAHFHGGLVCPHPDRRGAPIAGPLGWRCRFCPWSGYFAAACAHADAPCAGLIAHEARRAQREADRLAASYQDRRAADRPTSIEDI
jgi:hypothetical protein